MEKKLTDEDVIKAAEYCASHLDCSTDCPFDNAENLTCCTTMFAKLINKLQSESETLTAKRKRILANRIYSDSTLKGWTKDALIEHIRVLEHNWASAEESLANSVKNSDEIFAEQKAEIERLTERIDTGVSACMSCDESHNRKVKEILQEVDNLLHEAAMEYANAGHKDYFGVCENIHWKVIRKIAKDKGVEIE